MCPEDPTAKQAISPARSGPSPSRDRPSHVRSRISRAIPCPKRRRSVMRVLGVVLAIGIGLVSWPAALALGGWGSPLRALDSLLLWAPVVGAALPIAVLQFVKGAKVSGAWVAALAPLLGVLNALWSVDFYTSYLAPGLPSDGPIPWVFMVFSAMWLLPWLYVIYALRKVMAGSGHSGNYESHKS